MISRYVFDLDNTLIYTNRLNNKSYNHALNQMGLAPIIDCERITRDIVFMKYPQMGIEQKLEIIKLKQEFFMNNIQYTEPNEPLLIFLKSQNTDICVLWTSADVDRVQAILEYYIIDNAFRDILFSHKINITNDIEKICALFGCKPEELAFFEDDGDVIEKLVQQNLYITSI